MKITICTICSKPFFQEISTTGEVVNFDPNACPRCNAFAVENSKPILGIIENEKNALNHWANCKRMQKL